MRRLSPPEKLKARVAQRPVVVVAIWVGKSDIQPGEPKNS